MRIFILPDPVHQFIVPAKPTKQQYGYTQILISLIVLIIVQYVLNTRRGCNEWVRS